MTARLANNNTSNNRNVSGKSVEKKTTSKAAPSLGGGGHLSGALGATTIRPSEGRRANKPLMEKRRRARINQSLAVLKTLILDSARLEQNTKHSKLEKADILELTVRHLQRQKALGSAVLSKYRAGFQECTREVTRFLDSSDPIAPSPTLDPAIKQRLLRHLDSCISELDLDFHLASVSPPASIKAEADSEARPDSSTAPAGDDNNNNNNAHVDNNRSRDSMESSGPIVKFERGLGSCGVMEVINRPQSSLGGELLPQSCLVSANGSPSLEDGGKLVGGNPLLSVVQVIPSRLPDGQVVFLLPSHYVQLVAAAAASSMSQQQCNILPSASSFTSQITAGLPTTLNSLTTSILAWHPNVVAGVTPNSQTIKQLHSFQIKEEFQTGRISILTEDQPIDFTVTKRRDDITSCADVSPGGRNDDQEMMSADDSVDGPVAADFKDNDSMWRPW